MMNNNDIPVDLRDFLEKSVGDILDNFLVETHDKNKQGEGFLGEFLFISLTNKTTSEVHHIAVKQAIGSDTGKFVSNIFHTELWAYDHVWPELWKFQDKYPNAQKFEKIPKLYAVETKKGGQKISLENLKHKDFRNHDKATFIKNDHLEYILRVFGEFHALSMAYRESDPENFRKICDPLVDNYEETAAFRFIDRSLNNCCQNVLSTLNENTEKKIIEKFEVYAKKGGLIFREILRYKGKHPVLTHGDSWSNNMMFKYDESDNIVDMRLIDFQFYRVGTVVFDISFCIYSGVSKETLDNLDHYLRIYHQSLSESLRAYNLDPEQVYSYDVFMQEWKQYSNFGLILGIANYSLKNMPSDSDAPSFMDMINEEEKNENIEDLPDPFSHRSEKFLKAGRNLVLHAYENDNLI